MKEHPILFSDPMVRAILDGRKTQTRRVVNPQPIRDAYNGSFGDVVIWDGVPSRLVPHPSGDSRSAATVPLRCPYGGPGDVLWVRETWQHENGSCDDHRCGQPTHIYHRATETYPESMLWRTPIFMPRWASRLSLRVVSVRVQRLQDITPEDSRREGARGIRIPADEHGPARLGFTFGDDDGKSLLSTTSIGAFLEGWDSINGKRAPWSSNPWVWVVEFEREAEESRP